ncbi:MAG: tetratricopeptide repeat protein [Pirellulales bacterium]|nr:tetratricopeptide repeat protein [Pirellulales bacterium]
MYDESIALEEAGQLDAAIAKLHEILAIDATYALAHAALAVFYQKQNAHDKAIEHAQKVSELEPDDPFSFTALSVTCQRAFAGTGNRDYIQKAEEAMIKSHEVAYR